MHPKPKCSKCGLCKFSSVDDLETHIVKQHFNYIDAFYKCSYPKCWSRFHTEIASLKHELDVHLSGVLCSGKLFTRRHFVQQRLAIHDCLNESINVTGIFSVPAESNVNNSESLTTNNDEGNKRTITPTSFHLNPTTNPNSVVELVARSTTNANSSLSKLRQSRMDNSTINLDRLGEPIKIPKRTNPTLDRLFESEDVKPSTTSNTSVSKLRQSEMDNSGPNDKNKKKTEREYSPRSQVVKDEPSDELTQNIPASSNRSDSLTLGNTESIDKNNERTQLETSSKPFMIKDEPSLIDELAETIPAPSNNPHSYTQQTNSGGVNSSRFPENLISSESVEHANLIVKEEPIPIDELSSATYVLPNHNNSITSNIERIKHANSVVKEEPTLIDEVSAATYVLPNYNASAAPSQKPKRSRKQNFADLYLEDNRSTQPQTSSSPSVVKDEPSLIDELAADIPGPSNHDDNLTSSNNVIITDAPPEAKRPRPPNAGMQLGTKCLTVPQMQAIVSASKKGTPTYVIANIFDTSMRTVQRILKKTEGISMDSDDEIRRVLALKRRRPPTAGPKPGTKPLTVPQMQAIIKASEQGTKTSDIAKMFDISLTTVYRALNIHRSEGTVVISMDSDDEMRSVSASKLLRPPNSEEKTGTKCLTIPQMQAIVRANEQGTETSVIAKIFDTSLSTVERVLSERTQLQRSSSPSEDETSSIDDLVADIPGPSNHDNDLDPSNNDFPNPKISRMQNLDDEDGDDDRDSLKDQEDDLKNILSKERKQRRERKYTTPAVRQGVVNAYNEGVSNRKIAKIFDINGTKVTNILNRWKTDGTIERKSTMGRVRRVSKVVQEFILNTAKEDPLLSRSVKRSEKSVVEIKSEIFKKFNITISNITIERILRRTTEKDLSQSKSMRRKPVCPKCGQCDFSSLDNLKTHIVKQHFNYVDAFYKCLYPKCYFRFPTELARLKHELDVHLSGDLALQTLTQIQNGVSSSTTLFERRYVVKQRLAIHDCLNQSINVTGIFSVPAESNVNNSQSLTTNNDDGKKRRITPTSSHSRKDSKTQDKVSSSPTNKLDSVIESVARSKEVISSVSPLYRLPKPRKQRFEKYVTYDQQNKSNERENSQRSCVEKVGPRLVNVSVTALDHGLSNNEITDKNNETIEPGRASKPSVVKEEPSFMDELAETVPISSDHSDKLSVGIYLLPKKDKISSTKSHLTNNLSQELVQQKISEFKAKWEKITKELSAPKPEHKRNEHENSVVKDEPCVVEELTTSFAAFPDHDYLSFSNNGSGSASLQPKRSRIEMSPETSSKPAVVKDEPSLMDELASTIPVTSDHSDTLTVGNIGKLTPALERRPQRQQNLSNPAINLDHLHQSEGVTSSMAANSSISKLRIPDPKEISEPSNENNVRIEPENSSRSCVVKVGQRLINVMATPLDPVISNDSIDKGNDMPDHGTTSGPSLIKNDWPGTVKPGTVPVSSNYSDYLTRKAKNAKMTLERYHRLTPEEKKVWNKKRNIYWKRKQGEKEMAALEAGLRETSSNPSVVKDEPSLIDELAADIPGPSNQGISLAPSNNVINTDSDDEVRIVTAPKRPFIRKYTIGRKKKTTPEIEQFIMNASQNDVCLSVSEAVIAVKKKFGVQISDESVCSIRHRNGLFGNSDIPGPSNYLNSNKQRASSEDVSTLKYSENLSSERAEHENSVVKDEPSLIDELAADIPDIPGPSNYRNSNKQREGSGEVSTLRYSENLSLERAEHENSVVKDEPSLIDELAAIIPAPSNIDDYSIRSNNELLSSNAKKSRKQNLDDVDDEDDSVLCSTIPRRHYRNQKYRKSKISLILKRPKPKYNKTIEQFAINIIKEDPSKTAADIISEIKTKFDLTISHHTANKILKRNKPRTGPKHKYNETIQQFAINIIKEDPAKTAVDVIAEIKKKFDLTISHHTVQNILRRSNSVQSMHPKPECSKCGQRDFASLDNLETHIVKQHFSDVDEFYECFYPRCRVRFSTALAYLKHELDVHLNGVLCAGKLIKRRHFVQQRLAIHDCLNESINVTGIFSVPAESNANNSESPTTTDDDGNKSTNTPTSSHSSPTNYFDSVIESVACSTNAISSVTRLNSVLNGEQNKQDPALSNNESIDKNNERSDHETTPGPSLIKDEISEPSNENNMRIEPENSSRSCVMKVGQRLINVMVTPLDTANSSNDSIAKGNKRSDHETTPGSSLIKDEWLQLMAGTVPVSSNRSDNGTLRDSEPIEKNNKTVKPSSSPSLLVVKDEPCLIEEFAPAIPDSSNHHNVSLTPSNSSPPNENKGKRSTNPQISSSPANNPEPIDESINAVIESVARSKNAISSVSQLNSLPEPRNPGLTNSVLKRWPYTGYHRKSVQPSRPVQPSPELVQQKVFRLRAKWAKNTKSTTINLDRLFEVSPSTTAKTLLSELQNCTTKSFAINDKNENRTDREKSSESSSKSFVVKDEPSMMDELAAAIPGPSNQTDNGYLESTSAPPNQKRSRIEISPETSSSSSVIKDEPSLIDELAADIPVSSDRIDNVILGNSDIPGPSNYLNSNKQRASSEDVSTLRYSENLSSERTEHENSVVKDEPSLIDELAAMIPAPSNRDNNLIGSNNELLPANAKKSRKQNLNDMDNGDNRDLFSKDLQIVLVECPGQTYDSDILTQTNMAQKFLGTRTSARIAHRQELRDIEIKRKERNITTPSVRRAIIKASSEGFSLQDIGKYFNITPHTAWKILKKWKTEGTVENKPKYNETIQQFVVSLRKENPFIPIADIISGIQKKFDLTISHHSVQKILIRYNSPQKKNLEEEEPQTKPVFMYNL
ncbi:homeodomain-like domain-containing protein [Ditylenchus destructor]|nr:homeodomain-like domain-containing protein [Ditylenchus destructor]